MDMEYRRLGKCGLKVGVLSLGAWVTFGVQVSDDVAEQCMAAAYEAGCNFFDNAEAYADGRAEVVMGRILKRWAWRRETFIVSSKVFWGGTGPNEMGLSRKHVIEACHAALRRLQVDYLDLYFCHRPDPETPIEETVRAMHDLITQGKVLYWGTSEWSPEVIEEAFAVADRLGLHRPVVEQPQYNMFWRHRLEVEYKDLCARHGLGTTTWSPLMSGLITTKYLEGIPPGTRVSLRGYEWLKERFLKDLQSDRANVIRELADMAASLDSTLAQLAIAWCAKNPQVSTVITGASNVDQVRENMGALEVLPRLTDTVMKKIESILRNRPTAPEA